MSEKEDVSGLDLTQEEMATLKDALHNARRNQSISKASEEAYPWRHNSELSQVRQAFSILGTLMEGFIWDAYTQQAAFAVLKLIRNRLDKVEKLLFSRESNQE